LVTAQWARQPFLLAYVQPPRDDLTHPS